MYLPYILSFLLGFFSISFKIIWLKGFTLIFGNSFSSFSSIISAYTLSVAIGGLMPRLISKHIFKPLTKILIILITQCLILVGGILLIVILFYKQNEVLNFMEFFHFIPKLYSDFLTTLLLISIPTILTGMNLPMIVHMHSNRKAACVYEKYTLGAVLGCAFTSFLIIPAFGYTGSISLYFFCGLFLLFFLFLSAKIFDLNQYREPLIYNNNPSGWSMLTVACSGFIFFSLEVVILRILTIVVGDRAYVQNFTLLIILCSSLVGTSLYKKYSTFLKRANIVWALSLAGSFSIVLQTQLQVKALIIDKITIGVYIIKFLYIILIAIVPTILANIIFTDVISKQQTRSQTGTIFFINSLFAMIGALLTNHLLVPLVGSTGLLILFSFLLIILFNAIFSEMKRKTRLMTSALLVAPVFFLYEPMSIQYKNFNSIYKKEAQQGLFTVFQNSDSTVIFNNNHRLVKPTTDKALLYVQRALAYFPSIYSKSVDNILTIGLGYGITTGAFTQINTKKITVVEILKEVEKNSYRFIKLNNNYMNDKRVSIIEEDGAIFLLKKCNMYNIISVNTGKQYSTFGARLFTKEFYSSVKKCLTPDGIFAIYIPYGHASEMISTLSDVFSYLKFLPAYDSEDFLVIASNQKLHKYKSYSDYRDWKPYDNKNWTEFEKEANDNISSILKSKPRFIISEKNALLEFSHDKYSNYLWSSK